MSRKQFITAEEHLAKLGVTVQQALDFIETNVGQPEIIFAAADELGVTTEMLSEITNISASVIHDYFSSEGLDVREIDDTSILVNSDLGSLEHLVNLNNYTGILSTVSLRETVQPALNIPGVYDFTFGEVLEGIQSKDGIYDAAELGVGHLGDVPATNESIESLFYGTLINIFSALNESELDQINTFQDNSNPEEFQMLLFDALSESPSPIVWADEILAELVTDEAIKIINNYWGGEVTGILDNSYLGMAIA